MALKFQGLSYPEIAAKTGVPAGTLRNWYASGGSLFEEYKRYCDSVMNATKPAAEIHAEARSVADTLKAAAPAALQSIIDLSSGAKREQVKLAASADILDRAGYMPVSKMINVHMVEELSIDQLDSYVLGILGKAAPAPDTIAAPVYKEGAESIDVPDLTRIDEAPLLDDASTAPGDGDHREWEGG